MIHQNYKGLMTKAQGEAWFAVAPESPAHILPFAVIRLLSSQIKGLLFQNQSVNTADTARVDVIRSSWKDESANIVYSFTKKSVPRHILFFVSNLHCNIYLQSRNSSL